MNDTTRPGADREPGSSSSRIPDIGDEAARAPSREPGTGTELARGPIHAPDAGEEPAAVRDRYARRSAGDARYRLTNPSALLAAQERQRAVRRLFERAGLEDLGHVSLLEVGSGGGGNLLEMLWFGFAPEHLVGVELLADRHDVARARLPSGVRLFCGDAAEAPWHDERFDIVYASTVFSSLLDDAFQARLANAMWQAVKPGGAVLWYDFGIDNPRNRDVRGVPLARIRQLFAQGRVAAERITLAPPLARAVSPVHATLYACFNLLPLLRTHWIAWIAKPMQDDRPAAREDRP